MLSIILKPDLRYPTDSEGFSPSETFPEYKYPHLSSVRNNSYSAVRECFAQAGLDASRYGSPEWNPLGVFVKPGSKVFVLCNFVQHRRANESVQEFFAKCTHGSVLRAVVDYLLLATGDSGQITFGNAPLQSANWNSVLQETGAQAVLDFYRSVGAPVNQKDLRLLVSERSRSGNIRHHEERDAEDAITFDLGTQSLLAALTNGHKPNFRVSDYNPDRTENFHANGRHAYAIHKEIFAADVVFSLPKLKTHQKVGLTCGLKGFVGTVAHKDCLAHHRFGPPQAGGDEYPQDRTGILRQVSTFHDLVQRTSATTSRGNILRVIDRLTRGAANQVAPITAGSWHGNDTAWRMALDVARIVINGDANGVLHNEPQRLHLSLIDGIVGGEGEGPLKPMPVNVGALVFSDDVALGDWAAASMIGFDPQKLPIIREVFRQALLISRSHPEKEEAVLNGSQTTLSSFADDLDLSFAPPIGWRGFVEKDQRVGAEVRAL
ncbi:MAG TPA: DUF362 domain-containing protein [Pyrinomonadaceae bacterium]|jgi:uncharacterized protein (DUF362 family)|nr:DUF362 domain-containing protein [Pyrinomonadaceae bacterium]